MIIFDVGRSFVNQESGGDADRLCLLARYRLRNSNMIDHKIGIINTRIPFLQGARASLSLISQLSISLRVAVHTFY